MTPEVRARVIELAREGQSCRQIAAEVGLHRGTVGKITAAEGISFEQRARTEQASAIRSARTRERRSVLAEETLDAVEIAMATLAEADTPREVSAVLLSAGL